jgi:hypothetical protein
MHSSLPIQVSHQQPALNISSVNPNFSKKLTMERHIFIVPIISDRGQLWKGKQIEEFVVKILELSV